MLIVLGESLTGASKSKGDQLLRLHLEAVLDDIVSARSSSFGHDWQYDCSRSKSNKCGTKSATERGEKWSMLSCTQFISETSESSKIAKAWFEQLILPEDGPSAIIQSIHSIHRICRPGIVVVSTGCILILSTVSAHHP
jgi:hypothetical protein